MALHRVLGEIFQSILKCSQEGELIVYTDGYERLCFPVLSGWIADQPEHANLQNISTSLVQDARWNSTVLGALAGAVYAITRITGRW
jgi:hypothetical protein